MLETYAGMLTWGIFLWFAIAVVLTVGVVLLVRWLRDRGIATNWYHWLIGLAGIVLLLFTFQNFYGSWMEGVPQASWMFLLVTGVPSLVLIAIAALAVWRRHRKHPA